MPYGSWNYNTFDDWKQKNIIDIYLFDIKENCRVHANLITYIYINKNL